MSELDDRAAQLFLENARDSLLHCLGEYQSILADELEWDARSKQTDAQLVSAARQARREIAEGKGEPMNYNRL